MIEALSFKQFAKKNPKTNDAASETKAIDKSVMLRDSTNVRLNESVSN